MAVPTEFLRGLLGFLGMSCAFIAGRSAVAVRKGWQKPSKLYGWAVRTLVCVVAVAFRNRVLSVLRQKPPEDLTPRIFPGEP